MKVVSGIDSWEMGICQNPELASGLENTLAHEYLEGDRWYST